MTTSVFEQLKDNVQLEDAARRYGLSINRGNMVRCPFHKNGTERNPSMKLYPHRYKCFTCGASGDVIELAQQMHSLSTPLEAAKLLDKDYGLNLFRDTPMTPGERKKAEEAARKREDDKALVKAFNAWWDAAWRTVMWYHWHLKEERERLRPRSMDDDFTIEFCHVLHEAEKVEYMLDCLMADDERERIDFYAGWREKVNAIEQLRQSLIAQGESSV